MRLLRHAPLLACLVLPASAACSSSGLVDTGSGEVLPVGAVTPALEPDAGGEGDAGKDAGTRRPDSGHVACTTKDGPVTGKVGATTGSLSRLVFAVVGDTRPVHIDDPSVYPTGIITRIFQDIEALPVRPPLVVSTGDYQFSSTGPDATADEQVSLYMEARQSYSGAFFPAMGNHECGASGPFTTSDDNNCGPHNPGGATPNYNAFMNRMLGPIAKRKPFYEIDVEAEDFSWSAKFVLIAANAWDDEQRIWLEMAMARPTTYTFVVRHEASNAAPPLPPGVAGSDAVLARYPYTLLIAGHAHTYAHEAPKVVILGNGGAPLSSKDYGYGLFSQRCDGAIEADEIDYLSGKKDRAFHFVLTPEGEMTN